MSTGEPQPDEGLHDEIYKIIRQDIVGHTTTEKRVKEILSKAQAHCEKRVRGLIEFIEWLRDEEAVAQDDWDLYCKDKFEALKGKGEG